MEVTVLLSFRVSNYRSFRDEQELLLVPAYEREHPAVPVAAVYGANASGKSNLIEALGFMRTAVVSSHARWEPEEGVPRDPFRLDPETLVDASAFAVDLLLDEVRYSYGFAVDDERVREEWLYTYPRGRRRVLFERENDDFDFGPSFTGPKSLVADVTRENSLFLSAGAQQESMEQVVPIFRWFSSQLRFARSSYSLGRTVTRSMLGRDPDTAYRIIQLLRTADLGIEDVQIEEEPVEEERRPLRTEIERSTREVQELEARLQQETESAKRAETESKLSAARERHERFNRLVRTRESRTRIHFLHSSSEGPIALTMDQQSAGTRAWFELVGPTLSALAQGCVFAVDEVDASLHPQLSAQLIQLFQDPETNPHDAQLLFNTHDASLLGTMLGGEVLRRDQVWFVEKGGEGVSVLYPLTDFHPRKGENRERRYLGGSYGAVPLLDDQNFAEALGVPEDAVRG